MCGIVGAYAKQQDVMPFLLETIKRLEYRGYDSAGAATLQLNTHSMQCIRIQGKVSELEAAWRKQALPPGPIGIAHTRWATHGKPSAANAHPHCSHDEVAIVHNGIIENHAPLKQELIQQGYVFRSQTDSEVIAHLLHYHWDQHPDPDIAIRNTIKRLQGSYAVAILFSHLPHALFAARQGSPLVIGAHAELPVMASDPIALLPVTQHFIHLQDGDIVHLLEGELHIEDYKGHRVQRPIQQSSQTIHLKKPNRKGGYPHWMLQEIFEQPDAVRCTLSDHYTENQPLIPTLGRPADQLLPSIQRLQIIACGTSYHAGLVARHWFERWAGLPCCVEVSSEYRYRQPIVEPGTLLIALSQSGETADTLSALIQAKRQGYAANLTISNIPDSSLVRESDMTLLTQAGVEISVAATKTFTTQLVALLLLVVAMGRRRNHLSASDAQVIMDDLQALPGHLETSLAMDSTISHLAQRFVNKQQALLLGRGIHYPIALEAALKFKELSYMQAEAYPAGELKHGPLALVNPDMPVIAIAPKHPLSEKLASNIQEVQARGGEVYVLGDTTLAWPNIDADHWISMPPVPEVLTPIVYTLPLQLLAYYIAVSKGANVDQPRNLAKSVTVE